MWMSSKEKLLLWLFYNKKKNYDYYNNIIFNIHDT